MELRREQIPLESLVPSPFNKRVIDESAPKFLDLVQSVKTHGVLQPIVVRAAVPQPEDAIRVVYEIVVGHRRVAASRVAEAGAIDASVRDLDDAGALEVLIAENMEREDLSPLEEAEQIKVLRDAGWDTETIARKLGRSRRWVYTRAKVADLIPAWKAAILAGSAKGPDVDEVEDEEEESGFDKWSIGHLEQVALAPPAVQEKLLHEYHGYWAGIPTIPALRSAVDRYCRKLGEAPFSLEDRDLVPQAGGCIECPFRRGNQPDLFEKPAEIAADDTCMNEICFQGKIDAHLKASLAAAREKDKDAVSLEASSGYWQEGQNKKCDWRGEAGYYVECGEDDPEAVLGVSMGKQGDGSEVHVKMVHEIERGGFRMPPPMTVGRCRNLVDQRRTRDIVKDVDGLISNTSWADLVESGKWDVWRLVRIVLLSTEYSALGKKLAKLKEKTDDEVCEALWEEFRDNLVYSGTDRTSLRAICNEFGWLDLWKGFLSAAREKFPEPDLIKGMADDEPAPEGWKEAMPD